MSTSTKARNREKSSFSVPPEHYIMTNRLVTKESLGKSRSFETSNGEFIVSDGSDVAGDNIRFGKITFSSMKKGAVDVELYPDPTEEKLAKVAEGESSALAEKFPSMQMFDELYKKTSQADAIGKCEILFFVHGFSCDLEDALQTVQKLHEKYVENEECPIRHIVLFTWPAMNKNLRYRNDALDAINSGYALARGYRFLKDYYREKFGKARDANGNLYKPCDQYMHLMCHSMGNRVLESMFKLLLDDRITINAMFANVFLMAADIDYTALEEPNPLYNLIDFTERVHVYYHEQDLALSISEKTKNALNRLGRYGTRHTNRITDDVFQCNVTGISDEIEIDDRIVHHWYHYGSDTVVNDVIEVINGRDSAFLF